MTDQQADEEAVWRAIDGEHVANWTRDFESYARRHAPVPYSRFWGWVRGGGIVIRNGWEDLGRRMREDMEIDREPNPLFAFRVRRQNPNLRISGDMAFATYENVYPTADLPGFRGPGNVYEVRVLERMDGEWRIIFKGILDDRFGQTSTPVWEIDAGARVIRQNPAATELLNQGVEIVVRAGRLRMRDAATDAKLQQAIAWTAKQDRGAISAYSASPVVFDPGHDLPARLWWVITEAGRLMVSLNDPALAAARIAIAAAAYGLSPSQHRLAVSIVAGLTLTDAAKREGIRRSTARTQLQRIFDKVGVRTQPALATALMAAAEPD